MLLLTCTKKLPLEEEGERYYSENSASFITGSY